MRLGQGHVRPCPIHLVALMVQMAEAGAGISVRGFLGFREILVLRDAQGPVKRDGFHPALCPSSASCGLTFGRLLCLGVGGPWTGRVQRPGC